MEADFGRGSLEGHSGVVGGLAKSPQRVPEHPRDLHLRAPDQLADLTLGEVLLERREPIELPLNVIRAVAPARDCRPSSNSIASGGPRQRRPSRSQPWHARDEWLQAFRFGG